MSVIWSGITEEGAVVPVQVDESGRVIATQKDSGLDFWEKDGDVLKPSGGESVSVEGTISSAVSFLGPTASFTADITIHGLSIGRGGSGLDNNTAFGRDALLNNTEGINNTAVGQSALLNNTEGYGNTAVGRDALVSNTEGIYNTAVGQSCLSKTTTGDSNTAVGRNALQNNTEGNNNTAVGQNALSSSTKGESNTAFGRNALFSNTEGIDNTSVGRNALNNNITGDSNTAVGRSALFSNTEGIWNTACGRDALVSNTEGIYNTAVGKGCLSNLKTGDNNTFIGLNPGIDGLNDTVCISAGETYRLWIDSKGQAGVGTNNPQATLDVAGPALFSNGLCGFLASGEIFFQSRNTSYKLVVSSNGLVSAEAVPTSLLRLEDRQELVIPPAPKTNEDDGLSVVVMDNDNA